MRFSKWFVGLLMMTGFAQGPSLAQDARTGDPQNGRKQYLDFGCYQCHGMVAQGGRGPVMARMQYPFEAFQILVRQPAGGGMPAYTQKVLTEQELYDIFSYLKSLPGPPATADLPELLR